MIIQKKSLKIYGQRYDKKSFPHFSLELKKNKGAIKYANQRIWIWQSPPKHSSEFGNRDNRKKKNIVTFAGKNTKP